ncbi:LGFP repeat-containing protein [Agromyces mariniharenae]|uniref:LGFP repeat-containing protein n=1 Tax=Agromyces mariniharenae TaxID=2604423 RepID=A0A5S4V3C3_9MICO|nr:hypothetical protein [Agromyces mariniharenae]TYL52519.1 hypothetical protein FYC51_01800 [Agromyces mariniharenae]
MTEARGAWRGLLVVASLVAALLVPAMSAPQPAAAADFDAGNIISDANFYNGSAMTEAEIQQFLEARVGSCQNSNCLAVYRADTPTRTWSFGSCSTYAGGAAESAARIIFKVQQACRLSAKVILVTLQKEQSLLTNPAPSDGIMRKAMGYGCPDTAACDSTYYGFFNQVFAAGRQLTWYGDPAGSFTWIRVGQVNAIQYHPNAGCGTKDVLVRNRATAALYYYTPYTPNAAALANLGGIGDACSAYGNRNFWVFYNTWFGPTVGADPRAMIDAEHAAQGGAAGPLGTPVSDVIAIPENGGGYGRAYQGGSIYWSPAYGAKTVLSGPIRDYYFARGGAAGWLAWPQFNAGRIDAGTAGIGQSFSGGSVYSSNVGTFAVPEALRPPYFAVGGALGVLGWPSADAVARPEGGGGTEQRFQGGAVYRSGAGAFAVPQQISAAHDGAGGVGGRLGWPTSAAAGIAANGGGIAQAFGGGSVYASPAGAFPVEGAVRDAYFTVNGSAGRLGWPIGAAACASGSCRQDFQYGSIIAGATGAKITSPEIDAVHAGLGGNGGVLGAATTGLLRLDIAGGGMAVAYQNGSIYFKRSLGAFAVTGPVLVRYFATGGAAGPFGWPASSEQCDGGGAACRQAFEGGRLYRSYDDAARLSTDAIFAVYGQSGGARGVLGPTATDLLSIPQNGGGVAQAFAAGSIYSKAAAGTFAVSGAIRDRYFQLGGAAGTLGWPTTAASCAGGRCSQSFEGGAIDVPA